jgi:hypothetical protein
MATKYLGSTSGLTIISSAGQTRISSEFNSGVMSDGTKGAWLSSSDDTNLVGAELVTNGDGTSTTGWTNGNNATLSIVSGNLRVARNGTDIPFADQNITGLVVGKTYVATAAITAVSGGAVTARVDLDMNGVNGNGNLVPQTSVAATGELTFIATATIATLQLIVLSNTTYADFDDVSVRLADPDRSGNNKGLATVGTIAKTPVATLAEIMGYSGYSATDYQQQPYNSDLDFGTGDFSIEFWMKITLGAAGNLLHRSLSGGAGGLFFQIGASGIIGLFASASTSFVSVLTSTVVVATGYWEKVTLKRKSGVLSWTINGVLDNSVANTTNITYASAVLRIGRRHDTTNSPFAGILSEVHFANTARTEAEDLEAYNLEKPLFYPAALAVLSADDVTALSHDPVTGLLYAGGASGTATISGITPVTRDATAVSTFISVVDEMEVKQ